jgi:hypothetical protein
LARLVRRLLVWRRVLGLGLERLGPERQIEMPLENRQMVRLVLGPLREPLTLPPGRRRQALFVPLQCIAASLCAADFPARHRVGLLAAFQFLPLGLPVPMLFVASQGLVEPLGEPPPEPPQRRR